MREIKFRAWDKDEKKYLHWGTDRDDILSAIPRGMGDEWTERCVVEQFTGLYDKNGVEIYEGDILRCLGMTFLVYVEGFHGFRFMWGKDQITKAYAQEGGIVGNIHENPDLLDAAK